MTRTTSTRVVLWFLLLAAMPAVWAFAPNRPTRRYPATTRDSSSATQDTAAADMSAASLDKNKTDRPITSVNDWHRQRRRAMLQKYHAQIGPLERTASSFRMGAPLLAGVVCGGLWAGAFLSGGWSVVQVILLGIFPGSILSLWQLQILHDVLHGCFYPKGQTQFGLCGISLTRQQLQDWTLFVGSLPCFFGYHLYLHAGHLAHHQNTGAYDLALVFDSPNYVLEDGDVLFVAHRMHLVGDYGPQLSLPGWKKPVKMSISRSGFFFWKEGEVVLNALRFAASFLYERALLGINDVVVAATGRNFFFPNKPDAFHRDCARYTRVATALRLALYCAVGWKALLFLFVAETAWSLPPHPASAMFVSNHGSRLDDNNAEQCRPTASTYAGRWYSVLTLGTNYHLEHHDFPTIPFHQLHKLREIAPEFYQSTAQRDNVWLVMRRAFAKPEFYACSSPHMALAEHAVRPESQPPQEME